VSNQLSHTRIYGKEKPTKKVGFSSFLDTTKDGAAVIFGEEPLQKFAPETEKARLTFG